MFEELIPTPQKNTGVFFYQLLYRAEVLPAKATTCLKARRVKPELRSLFVPFDMNMRRFVAIC